MSLSKEDIIKLEDIIQKLFLEDTIPWVIGYSGGKDSTATLQLVWMALSKLSDEQRQHKKVHVISTDTLVESPVVAKWVEMSLKKMQAQAQVDRLPIVTHRLVPDYKDSFWVNLLGRGYPYPRITMRWCTDRLKIKPANIFIQDMVSAYGEVILLLGTRKAESANRAKSMQHYESHRIREFLSPNGSMQNELVFSPIEDWTNDDVWLFLMQYKNPWGYSNKDLLTMYRGATIDNECPLILDTDTPSCGKSRFGCWVCTLVDQDKSMEAMIMNDHEKEWMMPLLDFRNYIGNFDLDRSRRDFRRMTGNVFLYHGRLVHGPYKKEVREEWLRKLLRIQKDINQNGPAEFCDLRLITDEELSCIRHIWLNEKHEFDDSLPQIYEEEMGRAFIEESGIYSYSRGKLEWDLLREICLEECPDEELIFETAASIIDIEKKSTDKKKRYGVLTGIENQIRRGFYRNEEDALSYAVGKIERKKAMGASFDPKSESEEMQPENPNTEDSEV